MAELTKKTRVAIVEETTDGTPVRPTANDEYILIQDDLDVGLNFDTLDNAELKASIGQAAPLSGEETPTSTFSHYLRGSGTEGIEVQQGFSSLLKATYGGVEVNAAEFDTVAASTTTAINVDTAEGGTFAIGEGLLVKHSANDHELVIVKSVSGDVLTPLFELQTAPGTGVNLGKAISYRAADSGHPSLSLWDYRGNGAAIQLASGSRVGTFTVEAVANEILQSSFDMSGTGNFFNPLEVTSSNEDIDWTDDGGTFAATVSNKIYRTPIDLAETLSTAMNAQTGETITVTYSNTTGKYTIAATGSVFSLLWDTGVNTATTIGSLLGFAVGSDDTGALTYTSDSTIDLTSPQVPDFSNFRDPLVVKDNEVFLGGQSDNVCFAAKTVTYVVENAVTDDDNICEETGKLGSVITERTVTASILASIPKFDADKFERWRDNTSLSFQFNFGTKSGGNWVTGSSGIIAIKDAKVTAHTLGDEEGLVTLQIDVQAHVDDSGNSETSLNFL